MQLGEYNFIRFAVMFNGGPINGAVRFYQKLRTAKAVSARYVNKYGNQYIGGGHAYADVFGITESQKAIILFMY